MTHCVPDWDGNGGEFDDILALTSGCLLPPIKGRRDPDTNEPNWAENGHTAILDDGGKSECLPWPLNYGNNESGDGNETEDAVPPCKPPNSSGRASLARNEPLVDMTPSVLVPPVVPRPSDDDEMNAWLRFTPPDASVDIDNCSDIFGELPDSDISGSLFGRDSISDGLRGRAVRPCHITPPFVKPFSNSIVNSGSSPHRTSNADAAMALGAGRAAGLLPQAGFEAFTKVRTTMTMPQRHIGDEGTPRNACGGLFNSSGSTSAIVPSPKSQIRSLHPFPSGQVICPQYSPSSRKNLQNVPAVRPTSGTNCLKTASNNSVQALPSVVSSVAESTVTQLGIEPSSAKCYLATANKDSEFHPQSLGIESSGWNLVGNPLSPQDEQTGVNHVAGSGETVNMHPFPGGPEKCHKSSTRCSAGSGLCKQTSEGPDVQGTTEPTTTICSGGSGNSTDRALDAGSCSKRQIREGEESECRSEDGEYEVRELKKPLRAGNTAKRSRAAEVHNLSERRRRDRINERMKSLQELIPNSNKTDKASMLEEAIDYVKSLHAQLERVGYTNGMTGIGFSSLVVPPPIQLQMPLQISSMPQDGKGMRAMMGMGLMDRNVLEPLRPMHTSSPSPGSFGGHSPCISATSPAVSMVDSYDHHYLQNNSVMESQNAYLSRQQLQLPTQSISMNIYSPHGTHRYQQEHLQQRQVFFEQQCLRPYMRSRALH